IWDRKVFITKDLRQHQISRPLVIPAMARFKLKHIMGPPGKEEAVIAMDFLVNLNNKIPIGRNYRLYWQSKKGLFLARWMGTFQGEYYYSLAEKRITGFIMEYNQLYFYENGVIQEIIGEDEGLFKRVRSKK
ncbi:MAG: hypothetical protein OEZ36_11915, partial [Spirochaetota bacterium]|nr:hypothetical protein [Spirochaetota bacterium]